MNPAPLQTIGLIMDTFGKYPDYSAGCLKCHLILKSIHPEAEGFYNESHVLTKIGEKFYDIDGEQDPKGYRPFKVYGHGYILRVLGHLMNQESKDVFKQFYL